MQEEEKREVVLLQAQLDAVRNVSTCTHSHACRREKSEISVLLCTRAFLASLKETAEYRVSNEKLKKAADQEGKQLAQSSLGERVGDYTSCRVHC